MAKQYIGPEVVYKPEDDKAHELEYETIFPSDLLIRSCHLSDAHKLMTDVLEIV